MKSFRSAAAAIVLALTAATPAAVLAQNGTGTITGTVVDASGAAIPGTTVGVVNEGTQAAVEVISDGQGLYRATDARPRRLPARSRTGRVRNGGPPDCARGRADDGD